MNAPPHTAERSSSEAAAAGAARVPRECRAACALLTLLLLCFAGAGCDPPAPEGAGRPAAGEKKIEQETALLIGKSQEALHRGNPQAALALATRAARRSPQVAETHFRRGRALAAVEHFEEADDAYRQALKQDPQFYGAWLNLGNNASRQKRYRAALPAYRQARVGFPARANVLLGRAWAALGEADSAQAAYRAALAHDSANADAHLWLSLLQKEQGQLQEALRHARRAATLAPHNPDYQYVVGSQLVQSGHAQEALKPLQTAIHRKPWHYGAHYNYGRALAQLGRSEEAQRWISKADTLRRLQGEIDRIRFDIQNDPDNPQPWTRLADKLHRSGRRREAQRALLKARALTRPAGDRADRAGNSQQPEDS